MTLESDSKPRLNRDKTLAVGLSLYYHVANKDELLAGMVEMVIEEVNRSVGNLRPDAPGPWKATLRERILAARQVMLAHPWAPSLIKTRATMTPSVLTYFDVTLGLLRDGGFSYDLAHHSLHARVRSMWSTSWTPRLATAGVQRADAEHEGSSRRGVLEELPASTS